MNPQNRVHRMLLGSNFRSNDLTTLTQENFDRVMAESLYKAIDSPDRFPVKEKHVRALLIGSYQAQSGAFFWKHLLVIRLKEEMLVCWKFCYVLHKMLRDGPPQMVKDCNDHKKVLIDCGNMWRYVDDFYGKLIHRYCSLLYNRINFLMRHPHFPNDLKMNEELIGKIDINTLFDFSCELMDALEDVERLVIRALDAFEKQHLSSSTNAGKCLLAPLVACVQDASMLYEYCIKIMFKMHTLLDIASLAGHRTRFETIHKEFFWVFKRTRDLQYFRTLLQIPHVNIEAPNFLVVSDLQRHSEAGRVTVIAQTGDDTLVDLATGDNDEDSIEADHRSMETVDQAHGAAGDGNQQHQQDLLQQHQQLEYEKQLELQRSLRAAQEAQEKENASLILEVQEAAKVAQTELTQRVEEATEAAEEAQARMRVERDEFEKKMGELQASLTNLRIELEAEKEAKAKLEKDLNSRLKTVQDELKNVKSQLTKSEQDCEKANLDKEISSRAMRKMAEEMNQLKKETDTRQSKLLIAEMDETDKIIKDATRRIEELSEKSRKLETGVKLQVNEKISEVCTNLMKAVRNLIIQSDALQREVVSSQGVSNNVEEFYKRNSSWTEGLISAAKVVAMGAKSLVDAADRAMSGEGKYPELAAAAHEIATATTQLVVASRVKANKDSEKLRLLTGVAKQVNQCTGNVVDTARVCADLVSKDLDSELDISSLSLHQTKKLEMEAQVKLLELEAALSKERIKLGILRRRHYEQEEAQSIGDK